VHGRPPSQRFVDTAPWHADAVRGRPPHRLPIVELQAAIHRYLAEHNDAPQPFTWTKTADQILDKLPPLNAPVH